MPLASSRPYKPWFYFLGPHFETIFPYLFRSVNDPEYHRERVELPDGDFLDLDWKRGHSDRLLVLCHGLEGSSDSQYMRGMTLAAYERGWDVLCINFRSCSGEMNRLLRMYHHGEIEDLKYVIRLVLSRERYQLVALCGFSLGGNVILKYLGVLANDVPKQIGAAVAISVPCDLASSSDALDRWYNQMYSRRFMRSLKPKFAHKDRQFPGLINMAVYDEIRTWAEYDNTFTTAVTGFADSMEYYQQGSANNFLAGISTRTLLINAQNDPFLREPSYPVKHCADHPHIYLEMPRYGGHVGFWYPGRKHSWVEDRALDFVTS